MSTHTSAKPHTSDSDTTTQLHIPTIGRSRRSLVRAVLAVGLSVAGIGASTIPAQAAQASLKPGDTNADLIVMAETGQIANVARQVRSSGGVVTRSLPIINAIAVRTHAQGAAVIEQIPGVREVSSDAVLQPMGVVQAPQRAEQNKSKKPVRRTTTRVTTSVAPPTVAPSTRPTTVDITTTTPTTVPATSPISTASSLPATLPTTLPVTIPATLPATIPTSDTSVPGSAPSSAPTTVPPASSTTPENEDPSSDESPSLANADRNDKSSNPQGSRDGGSLEAIARATGARGLWRRGFTGEGVDVALIDTGVTPMQGLPVTINGADLSADANQPNLRFLDGYGHGTHMAGIIAGRDAGADPLKQDGAFVGIAPDARLINVKVGAMDGRVHSSQVIAALDWVVQNRQANGMNIRVVNLSYGAPATPDWRRDPLAWASEVAWRKGVLVVAASGNEGTGHQLSSPAYSPEILAVGATETEVTRGGRTEYTIAPYTSTGQRRRPDLFVPGGHVVSLRTKGSFVDTFLAKKNVGERFTRGSGTSQAAAVASGLAALLIEAYPTATPDQIKSMMVDATDFSGNRRDVTGIEASIDVTEAFKSAKKKLPTVQLSNPFATCGDTWCRGIGDGSAAFVDWAKAAWAGNSWTGSSWTGNSWTGSSWTGSSWTGSSWTGSYWTGSSWTQDVWAGSSWTGSSWTGSSWTGSSWTGSSWTGSSWAGSSWAGSSWAGTWDQ